MEFLTMGTGFIIVSLFAFLGLYFFAFLDFPSNLLFLKPEFKVYLSQRIKSFESGKNKHRLQK